MNKQTFKFLKGQVIHLDQVYDILAFCSDFLDPFNTLNKKGNEWKEETEEFTVKIDFEITITTKT